jgi:predicted GNAT superfamily acetyltransferase
VLHHSIILYGAGVHVQSGAQSALADAEMRAGVELRTLTGLTQLNDARAVFDTVWPSLAGATQVQSNLLHAIVHSGGYCSAAYLSGEPIGAALGFVGRHQSTDGTWQVHLHSHMAAVLEPYRNRHIGSALKIHQRLWCLDRGIPTVIWTFDPLVRRNAYVNLVKLGTEVRGYEPDFYGPMDDAINAGDPSDRMFAWWQVESERAQQAAAGLLGPVDPQSLDPGRHRVIALPDDIVALRASDPAAAQQWRIQVRTEFVEAMEAGYVVIGVSPDGDYVLERR